MEINIFQFFTHCIFTFSTSSLVSVAVLRIRSTYPLSCEMLQRERVIRRKVASFGEEFYLRTFLTKDNNKTRAVVY